MEMLAVFLHSLIFVTHVITLERGLTFYTLSSSYFDYTCYCNTFVTWNLLG
jgi:hypothetical protein